MKIFFTLFLSIIIAKSLFAQTKISADEAAKYVGERVTITAKVTGSVYNHTTRQTVLNLGSTPSSTSVMLLINLNERKNFSYSPENFLVNRNVSISGKLVDMNGMPGIVISRPEEIKLEYEGGADVEIRPLGFDALNKFFDEEE